MEKKYSKREDPLIGQKLLNKYTIIKKLGEGSFGLIYSAKSQHNWYAIKLESRNHGQNLLENEACIMCYLRGKRIPIVKSYANDMNFNILIMELMGKSLEEIFESLPNRKMTISCVAKLGYQMIQILEYIHDKHIIHRDIKPDNLAMGRNENNGILYLIDFGLAKKFRSSRTLKQFPLTKRKSLTGTARYASINALQGYEQSRRDDLESAGYVLMFLLRGNLPWQNIKIKGKHDKYAKICNKKKEVSSKELGKDFPSQFAEVLEYFKNLGYTEDPNYEMCWKKMVDVIENEEESFDYIYDWTTKLNIRDRKRHATIDKKQKMRRRDKKFHTTKLQKISEIDVDGRIKIKVKDVDDETESGLSNKADIDALDAPGNHSTQEDSQCCYM